MLVGECAGAEVVEDEQVGLGERRQQLVIAPVGLGDAFSFAHLALVPHQRLGPLGRLHHGAGLHRHGARVSRHAFKELHSHWNG
jgi:hypothetical protein